MTTSPWMCAWQPSRRPGCSPLIRVYLASAALISAHDGARERSVALAAFAEFQGHRQQSDNGGQRRHQDRPQAHTARHAHGLAQFHAA